MSDKPHIILLIGASASGKDTIKKYLLEKDDRFKNMIPITTRPMRSYEKDGVDYNFITTKEFEDMIDKNQLLEHRKYDIIDNNGKRNTWYYGHTNPTAEYNVMVAPLSVYNAIKYNSDFTIYPFYIHLKATKRLERMIERENKLDNPNYKELARRFFSDEEDFAESKLRESGLIFGTGSMAIENLDSKITADYIYRVVEGIKDLKLKMRYPWGDNDNLQNHIKKIAEEMNSTRSGL